MENVKQNHGFHKDVEVRLIDKTQASDPTKSEFYWMRTLRILYPDGLNIESDYQQSFRLTHTFTIMFGSPSTKVFSSVPVIVLS